MSNQAGARSRGKRSTAAAAGLLLAALIGLLLIPGAEAAGLWWDGAWSFRVPVTVNAGDATRTDKPVDVKVNYQALLGGAGTFDPGSVRVLEVDSSGNAVGQPLPAQYDAVTGDTTFIMVGTTAANTSRSFHLYFATTAAGVPAQAVTSQVTLSNAFDAGQNAYKVSTQAGDWYYQQQGASFSSLVDRDGRNWISYNSGPGASGEYRGIPNFPNPLGYFHPGFNLSNSKVVSSGPLRVVIESSSNNGTWAYRSVIYPRYVTSTVTKADPNKAYWWLYEGTPGGAQHYDELSQGLLVRSDGPPVSLTQASQASLPANEQWVYFGMPALGGQGRSLFMAQHEADNDPDDYFALYGEPAGSMTVWGFGRRGGDGGDYLRGPHTFTMGLMDTVSKDAGAPIVRGAYKDLLIQVGAFEAKGSTPVGTGSTTPPPTSTTQLPTNIPDAGYVALASPVRLLDTRLAGGGGRLTYGAPRTVGVTGAGRAPADATAAVLNVTAVGADQGGFVTVWPSGGGQPTASNVNYMGGDVVPNLVTVALGGDGAVTVGDGAGSTDVIVDLFGYYAPSVSGGRFHPLNPTRVLDTRTDGGPVGPGTTRTVSVSAGISHVSAVALNVTVVNGTAPSFLSVYPANGAFPGTSNLNFLAGQVVPNAVISGVGPTGEVALYNSAGAVDVVVDVVGWYDDGDAAVTGGLRFRPVNPTRALDTRPAAALQSGVTRDTVIAGGGGLGIPGNAQAVAVNVTVTEASGDAYLTVWPSGESRPTASTQNMAAGTTRANAALAKLGAGGAVSAVSEGAATHLIYDIAGYFQ